MNRIEENDYIRQTLRQAMPDDLPPAVAERLQNRLATFRKRFDTESPIYGFLPIQITHWIGELTMRQRIGIALSGTGVVVVLALLLLWGGFATSTVSAMEQMAENIRKAKSFKAVLTAEGRSTRETGKPPVQHKLTGTVYWLAQGLSRVDFGGIAPNENGRQTAEAAVTKIDIPAESREIIIDHKTKQFYKVELPKDFPGPQMVAKLGDFSGKADRELGNKEIDGKKSRGFEIDMSKLLKRPGVSEKGIAEIWIDTDSSLPVLVQFKMTNDRSEQSIRMQDFQWNIDLDPKLFDTSLPKGYTDVTSSFQRPPKQPRR